MPTRNTIHLLAALSQNTRDQVQQEIASDDLFAFTWSQPDKDTLLRALDNQDIDFVLLEFTDAAEEIIDQITLEHQAVGVVVVLPESDFAAANRLMLAGAKAFAPLPITHAEFTKVFMRLKELKQRSNNAGSVSESTDHSAGNRSLTVFSPRGGSGTTTLAINLSIALKQAADALSEEERSVLLVDSKSLFGHVDLMLNLKTENSLADVVPHVKDLDSRIIEDVVERHVSGIYVLPSPNNLSQAQTIEAEHIFATSVFLHSQYHLTVIDGGSRLDERTVTWMDTCERILLVLTPDLAALRDAQIFLEEANALSFPTEKVLVVLNKEGMKGGISSSEIEKALQRKIYSAIPYDDTRISRAINRGVPPIVDDSKSKFSKAIQDLASMLYGNLQNAAPMYNEDRDDNMNLLTASSRLG